MCVCFLLKATSRGTGFFQVENLFTGSLPFLKAFKGSVAFFNCFGALRGSKIREVKTVVGVGYTFLSVLL